MSANVNVFEKPEAVSISAPDCAVPTCVNVLKKKAQHRAIWNPEEFETAQLLGLVRQVFLVDRERKSRYVVFCAAQADTDITGICVRVAQTLASETTERVVLLEHTPDRDLDRVEPVTIRPLRNRRIQMANNLWRLSSEEFSDPAAKATARFDWPLCLARLRDEYAYAVIQGPALGGSGQTAFLGQLSDGIVLVLSAQNTRKAVARNIRQALRGTQCAILGTVLSRRIFPIPERIYRWL